MQLSQILGNQMHGTTIQQNAKQAMSASPLLRQLPQQFEMKDARNSPKTPQLPNQSNKDAKRVSLSYKVGFEWKLF